MSTDARTASRDARAASRLAEAGATLDAVELEVGRAATRGGPTADELLRWRGRLSAASKTVAAFAKYSSTPNESTFRNVERAAAALASD